MASHTLTLNWKDAGGTVLGAVTTTDAVELNADVAVNTGVTDQAQAFAVTLAKLRSLYLIANCDLTLKTNSTTAPGDTIALKAGVPLVWWSSAYHTNPFTVDITALYLSNSSGQQATLSIRTISSS